MACPRFWDAMWCSLVSLIKWCLWVSIYVNIFTYIHIYIYIYPPTPLAAGGARQGIRQEVANASYYYYYFPLLRFGHEIRWCFAVAHVPQSHAFRDWRAGWPQDVANVRDKLKSLSFCRVSEVALGPLFRVPLLRFGHEIRWCFAVAHVPQSHALCDWRVGWPQDVANLRNKLKSLSFSRVSEVALDAFLRFLCYVLGTKLGGVLPLRMCHKAMPFVIGVLVGRKMWQTCVTS